MDPTYVPQSSETRQVYGISLQQNRNDAKIDAELFKNIVTTEKDVSELCVSISNGLMLVRRCHNPP
jgi:phosphoribosylaminoimidazolecarboxamide formyltransferase / IMP cyclohydrolase